VGDNAQLAEIGVARISAKMGELYLVQGKFKESEAFLKQALDLFERTHGKDSKPVADCLTEMGAVYRAQGKYSSVEATPAKSSDYL
jgi:tetratricopeptide (TPR) repeat protein